MKKLSVLLLTSLLFSQTLYERKLTKENKAAMKNEKIKCRTICDKKLYKEQKMEEAISFYRNSKDYKFTKKDF